MQEEVYDAVVMAVHADVARTLLKDRTWYEDFVLGQVRYDATEIVIHTDRSMFLEPPLLRHYTYVQDDTTGAGFELHSLPGIAQRGGMTVDPEPVITLSPDREFDDERFRRGWKHHRQDLWHLAMVLELLPAMQGAGNVWYAGDWVTFIGHGPAIMTGLYAACQIGGPEAAEPLSTEPCVDVTLFDPLPSAGVEEKTVQMCGEQAIFDHVAELGCAGKVGP
jgi:predicted NAD/FAD-binding protein